MRESRPFERAALANHNPTTTRAMTAKPLPPIEVLRELFSYSPETGILIRKSIQRPAGHERRDKHGKPTCVSVKIGRCGFPLHRIAWALMTGDGPNPSLVIDHRDLNPHNNRWNNLRICTHPQNKQNGDKYRTAMFGPLLPKGVVRIPSGFRAIIRKDGRLVHLGVFQQIEDAATAFRKEALVLHGEFARV